MRPVMDNTQIYRARRSAPALVVAGFVLFSALYFRAQGFDELPEYEPRPQVQISSCLGYAPRLGKASISAIIACVPTLYFHAFVINGFVRSQPVFTSAVPGSSAPLRCCSGSNISLPH
jgi:hypothetical protein